MLSTSLKKHEIIRRVIADLKAGGYMPLKKQSFYACEINGLQRHKKSKNYVKQLLFHGNAMPTKGAYFAQHERIPRASTDFFRLI